MRPTQLRKLTVPEGGNLDVLATTHVKSMFASGLRNARGLIFDRAGKLFVAQIPLSAGGDILKFMRSCAPTVLASEIGVPAENGGPQYVAIQPRAAGGPS